MKVHIGPESQQQASEDTTVTLPEIHQSDEFCAKYHYAMEIIGKKWTGSILRVLIHGPHYYNEILLAIPGISDRLLTERLRGLEAEGLVVRHIASSSPVRVEYKLTEVGQELDVAIRVISLWAAKWIQM